MEKGRLRDVLSNEKEAGKLDCIVRLTIVKGPVEALAYMEHDCTPPVIHQVHVTIPHRK